MRDIDGETVKKNTEPICIRSLQRSGNPKRYRFLFHATEKESRSLISAYSDCGISSLNCFFTIVISVS